MAESKEQGTAFKNEGNGHFVKGEYEEAIKAYTAGIEVDPTNHLLFANRAASLYYMKQYDQALTDIEKAIELDKDYSKSFTRKGMILAALGKHMEAYRVFRTVAQRWPKEGNISQRLGTAAAEACKGIEQRAPEDIDDWRYMYAVIPDQRLKLATLANFWNLASPQSRFSIFSAFLSIVSPKDRKPEELLSNFKPEDMVELPLDSYADITVPEPWMKHWDGLSQEEKAEYAKAMWEECTTEQRDLIVKDLHFYISPLNVGGAGGKGGKGQRRKK